MLRHHGRLPRVSFPMLLKLSKYRRPKKTTACGNKVCRRRTPPPTCSLPDHPHSRPDALHLPEQVVAPMPVVLAERDRITQYIERQLRCGCGKRLRFSKAASHQVRPAVLPWLSPGSALARHHLHPAPHSARSARVHRGASCARSRARSRRFSRRRCCMATTTRSTPSCTMALSPARSPTRARSRFSRCSA